MVLFQSRGVDTSRMGRICRTYGKLAIIRVNESPHRLALDIQGIGFETV